MIKSLSLSPSIEATKFYEWISWTTKKPNSYPLKNLQIYKIEAPNMKNYGFDHFL